MVDRLKRLAHDTDAWIIRHRWSRIGRRAVMGFMQHNALNNAGSMAYFAILSVFQLLVLGVVVLSFFLGDGQARDFIVEQVERGSPLEANTVASIIDGVIESRGGIGLISGAFLLWSALGIFSALNRGISSAFINAQPRGFLQDKLIGLALMGVVGVLGVLSIVIGIVTGILQQLADDVLGGLAGQGLLLSLIGLVVPIVLIFIAFMAIYRLTPNRSVSLGEIWPGALVATVLWTILRIGFTYYATNVANYDSAFGPISTAITLLVFLYFASVVVLLGAEVARANVIDDEVARPKALFADAFGPATPAAHGQQAGPTGEDAEPDGTGDGNRLPGWALALGGTLAAAVVRWLASRVRGLRS